jgi:carboxymethylenebutenolidase
MKFAGSKRSRGRRTGFKRAGKTILILAAVALAFCASADANGTDDATPKSQMVEYKSGDQTVSGFLVTPDSPGKHPAMIVIHESLGLNDWVKEQATKLAAEGYVALAVDLYRGKTAADLAEAHELMRALPHERAVQDLKAAFAYLAARPDVKPESIGAIGWGTGAAFALQLAVHEPHLKACVVNYGALPTDPADIQNIGAPILGNFGALDRGITPDDVKAFEKSMTKLRKFVNMKIYNDAGHGFENPNSADSYRPEAAVDAWNRTVMFLRTAVK